MAGAADKARFYLEQSIPDLQELERKKIFSKSEITSIIKRRSDFEHKINGRGSKPVDFIRYTEFEVNVEALRSKKAKRLGVKSNRYTGHKRILTLLDRGTTKFPGDLALWMLYLNAAKKQKAFSRVSIIYTNLVRLHPTKPEVWIHAAKFAIDEHGDMAEARSFMQRGLRFCKGSRTLWLSYFRLELVYIAKVIRRQQILGLTGSGTAEKEFEDLDNPEADIVALPAVTQRDMGPSVATNEVVDRNALQALRATPALSGAIPIAIFDAAMNQFNGTSFAGEFVDLICNFDTIPCCVKVLQHVLDYLEKIDPSGSVTLDCWIRQPLIGVFHTTAQLAQALGVVFSRLRSSLDDHPSSNLVQRTVSWVSSYVQRDLDDSVKAVLRRDNGYATMGTRYVAF
ncbi:MAG: hypothetical protein LQ340_004805 [Diploschistes diacapsis]|nr:MAG: hypothetical protein LQ340_004805 [Diploschistes diacapsis]